MKGKVVPSNMKPLRPIRSLSSHQGEQLQKLLPAKSIGSSLTKNKALTHLLKYDEVGLPSAKGQRSIACSRFSTPITPSMTGMPDSSEICEHARATCWLMILSWSLKMKFVTA